MKAAKLIFGLLSFCVVVPITIYLQYQILSRVQATQLMWFLFWVEVPIFFLIRIFGEIADHVGRGS